MALLSYRATPLSNGFSPAELLMRRTLRTTLPALPNQLYPKWEYLENFKRSDLLIKQRQKHDYDKRYCVRNLPPLAPETYVWINADRNLKSGQVQNENGEPRSYNVVTPNANYRRNRGDIIPVPPQKKCDIMQQYVTRFGRIVKPPRRYPCLAMFLLLLLF